MPPDSTLVNSNLSIITEWIKLIGGIVGILGGLVGIVVVFCSKVVPYYKRKLSNRSLEKRFGADLYPKGVIEQATKYYIEPNCQSLDPAGGEEPRYILGTEQNLFEVIDKALKHPTEYRYLILLADSGMGKTSFLLNYYARNLRRLHKLELELLPLGIPDVDDRITKIKDKKNKVLFLDALDEDTLAIVDHVERLRTLMEFTRDFNKILLTCRTQFFPKDEEIPLETGVVKIGPKAAGEKAQYVFHKLYISPFTDQQVDEYLKRRYPYGQYKHRKRARELVQKIPHLNVRPMLLAHIKDLVGKDRQFKYSFELYEEMVEAWLIREEGIVEGIKKEPLRQFSEHLAIDLYLNRKRRGAERISQEELTEIAKTQNIPLDDWQLTGRSLLNRDAKGNYKFAHRSIMEYLFVKRFLETDPNSRTKTLWTDQMNQFLLEILYKHFDEKRKVPDLSHIEVTKLINLKQKPTLSLRKVSIKMSEYDVKHMIRGYDFFDLLFNKTGKGMLHLYQKRDYDFFDLLFNKKGKGTPHLYQKIDIERSESIVHDLSTGLMWQQSGSDFEMRYEDAKEWITELNQKGFAGFNDWRLPTLEEAMSLMEPEKRHGDLNIDPVFDSKQRWILTADHEIYGERAWAWVVYFNHGRCDLDHGGYSYSVRAVRSEQPSKE